MNTQRIVAIGHGHWGRNIVRNLHELGVLHGVCETSDEARAAAAELYPQSRSYASFDEVLADDHVRAVAISTPAASHARLAVEAMEAGRDVFVEKPLALTLADGQRVVETASRTGRILMVGHLLEYHPVVIRLAGLVREGALGRIQYVYSNRLNLGKFRREENILWSFAPHDIAVILRLVGEEPIEVVATGGAYLQPNVADVTVTNLLFDNGVRAHIFVSWLHPYKEQRLVVVGSEKMAVFDDRAEWEDKLVVYDQGADWVNNVPVPRKGKGKAVSVPRAEPLRAEMQHFVDRLHDRRPPLTGGKNGLQVLNVLQTAQKSLLMGGSRLAVSSSGALRIALS